MSFLSEEDIKGSGGLSMAPMLDFLFLMLMFFACLSVTRIATRDTEISLVEVASQNPSEGTTNEPDLQFVNISILADGHYKWVTDIHDYPLQNPEALYQELSQQYEKGLLPKNKSQTRVLLKIDKTAQWEPILKAIFAIREAGFDVHPVYEPDSQ